MVMHIRQEDRRPGLSRILAAVFVIKASNDRPLLFIYYGGTVSAGDPSRGY
jgi:hypothetical protein